MQGFLLALAPLPVAAGFRVDFGVMGPSSIQGDLAGAGLAVGVVTQGYRYDDVDLQLGAAGGLSPKVILAPSRLFVGGRGVGWEWGGWPLKGANVGVVGMTPAAVEVLSVRRVVEGIVTAMRYRY